MMTVAITVLSHLPVQNAFSQNDPLSLDNIVAESVPINEAFNGSYVINNQSSNVLEQGRLNFLILHRFGELSEGAFNAFGLDYAGMRMGFEYGVTNRLTVAIGRTSVGKNYDGHVKYRFKTQTHGGANDFPISLVGFSSVAFSAAEIHRQNAALDENQFINQLVYTTELIISRQFSETFSMELIPAMVHLNSVSTEQYDHNVYAVSAACRFKITARLHLTADYGYVVNKNDQSLVNPLGIGIDIVTGGHTFHVYLTNSAGMIEKEFLMATTGMIDHGDMRIGFTMSRAFMLKRKVAGGKLK
jgi:hypothetical protein